MSQIIQVELWKDVGFQEGAVEVPSKEDFLPDADIVFDDGIKTSTGDFFSNFTIPAVFSDYLSMSYVRVTYEYNNADELMVFYGWIDDVALRSDTDGSPSVSISWHIDYWRTYLASAKFGYGLVQNRPPSLVDPIQSCPYRYRELSSTYYDLIPGIPGGNCYWGIVNCTREYGDNKYTGAYSIVIPIAKTGAVYYKLGENTATRTSLTIEEWVTGKFDEYLGIAPSAISSVFISPLPPHKIYSGTGTENNPFILAGSEGTSPFPVTDTKTAYDTDRTVESTSGYDFVLEDGTRQRNGSGIYSISSIEGGSAHIYRGTHPDATVIYSSSGPSDYITVVPIDYIVKSTFGDEQWNKIANGDTVTINNAGGIFTGLDSNFSVIVNPVSATRFPLMMYFMTGETSDRTFTFNNGSFGTYYIYVHGRSNVLSLGLTTTETVVSSNEYIEVGSSKYGFARRDGSTDAYTFELPAEVCTTDTEELVVLDQNAIPIATMPWGMMIRKYTARVILSSVSAYLQFRFDEKASASEGLEVTIPLVPVDLSENSYSEYNFSGQRDYDVTQRRLATEQALVGSLTSTLSGGMDTAVMGALTNTSSEQHIVRGYKGDMGAPIAAREDITATTKGIGGLRAGAISMGAGVGTALVDQAVSLYYNGELQKAEDMLRAKQIDALITNGSGWDFLYHGQSIRIAGLKPDKYSVDRFEADKKLHGIICSEPMEDCTELINAGGPLRIAELIVTGEIPVHARGNIRGRFANGVRIVTKHKAPEVPTYDYLLVPRHYDGHAIWFKNEKGYTVKFDPDHLITGATLTKGPMDSVIITGTPEPGTYNIPVVYTDGSEGTVKILVN